MSHDPIAGHWEIRWQGKGDPGKYAPGTSLLIGWHGESACSVAWLDGDNNLCLLPAVSYDPKSHRLRGRCAGQVGPDKQGEYVVDIYYLIESAATISGEITAVEPGRGPNDDPLTGSWTADRRPGGEGEPGRGERGGGGGSRG